ncbi:MAG TPA: hypothetical protein VHE30_20130 [Polyangiaceae bacterium]|nr:hypothetical protein [Polyangiaceae bacterium]
MRPARRDTRRIVPPARPWRARALVALLLVAETALGGKHRARTKSRPPDFPADAASSVACRYAALEPEDCLAELARRDVHFSKAGPAPGVRTPIRLTGPLNGVLYRTDFPDSQREKVPFEILDCRLAVALSDFSAILKQHDIREVRLFSAWRPPPRGHDSLETAHPGGLAADLRLFKKSSGEELEVLRDFHGRIGATPCGPRAVPPAPSDAASRELRAIFCAAVDARLFHVLLSPNEGARHANHFHAEIRPEVRWFIVR